MKSLALKDLLLRMIVICLTSIIFLFATREDSFDLHFKIRKTQPTAPTILMVEVPDDLSPDKVVSHLLDQKTDTIFVSHFLYDRPIKGVTPYMVGEKQNGFLSLEIQPDMDGLTRRIRYLTSPNKDFESDGMSMTLNFRGPEETFPNISYYDLNSNGLNLEGKIIILKSPKAINTFTTPVGILSEAELIATVVDNQIMHRFLPEKNFQLSLIIIFALLVVTTLFLLYLPSTLALLCSALLAIAYTSLSLWLFDVFYFWTPISTPLIQIVFTFLLISNYKFVLNEQTRWNLERESQLLAQVEEMKNNFLSLFSHDLKTPLAKIIGIVDTLASKIDDPQIRSELEKIHKSSLELDKYIKRILKMSQVQTKNIALNKETVDLNLLIEQSIEQNLFLAEQKNITIEKHLSPLFMIEVDGSLIKEVINNFLENAITYSPQGKKVLVSSEEINDFIKISVKDEGYGIPKEVQGQIWEKAYRFDDKQSGYGLGLFLSRYVIKLHNGQVFLNSKVNSGSEFGFLLPLSEDFS